jgi:hypothetical protein
MEGMYQGFSSNWQPFDTFQETRTSQPSRLVELSTMISSPSPLPFLNPFWIRTKSMSRSHPTRSAPLPLTKVKSPPGLLTQALRLPLPVIVSPSSSCLDWLHLTAPQLIIKSGTILSSPYRMMLGRRVLMLQPHPLQLLMTSITIIPISCILSHRGEPLKSCRSMLYAPVATS